MLPIRFVAEGFNLGVAWESDTQTVSIIRDSFDDYEYNSLINVLPEYSGQAYTQINNNIPFFKDYEIIKGSFEYYSELDELGRCDVCFASIATDIMPTEERESISSITPTGWINANYDNVDGGYLYNRCHLIAFQLTGENANERNLITGTRYLNADGMLPFENLIADYIKETGNHVMYRSTPVFSGNNLVADGVLLEAYSVEDNGQGISFCVYCYNVQPQIKIDYTTGASSIDGETLTFNTEISDKESDNTNIDLGVYRTPSGKKYHFDAECGGKNSFKVSIDEAKKAGLSPCSKCAK
ncbi:MAG: DNA/RNA non-specific endonuclease [Clostridia bacterium]|nr:DNA/RNA non-specific endonuclease [Clostridia bacterium]